MRLGKRVLTVDRGNSITKFAIFEDGRMERKAMLDNDSLKEMDRLPEEWEATDVMVASSGYLPKNLLEAWQKIPNVGLLVLDESFSLPVDFSAYDVSTLGRDRIAAACGAEYLYPRKSVLIADAGTALTLDVLEEGRAFKGGNISPGLKLRFEALHNHTAALPLVNENGETPSWGHDTPSAIRSGVVNGIVYEIYLSLVKAATSDDCELLLITGGDAGFLYPLLKEAIGQNPLEKKITAECQPNLVAYGLYNIFNYNEKNKI